MNLSKKQEPFAIIGHPVGDPDSVISTWLLTKIFRELSALPVILGKQKLSQQTLLAIQEADINLDFFHDSLENRKAFLVDFHNIEQLPGAQVIGVIDHHPDRGGPVPDVPYTKIEAASSCAMLIYRLFKETYFFSSKEKKAIAISVVTDTMFLHNKQKLLVADQEILADWFDMNEFNQYCLRKFLPKADPANIYTNQKWYHVPIFPNAAMDHQGVSYNSGCVYLRSEEDLFQVSEKKILQEIRKTPTNFIFLLYDMIHGKTTAFVKLDIASSPIFIFHFDKIMARGSHIMPFVRQEFLAKKQVG